MSELMVKDDRLFIQQASASIDLVKRLNMTFDPHPGQVLVLDAIFGQGKQITFVDCGRKWGKTQIVLYILYRWALFSPGNYYYIAPYAKQAREIIWASRRIQDYLPPELKNILISKVNDSEMRLMFSNGSFIKLDGADNFDAYRGVNPHGAVYEEFKDHRPEFHRAFGPNLATNKAPLVIIGTPEVGDDTNYNIMAEEIKFREDGAYFNMPTWINPHIDLKWLAKEKKSLERMGRPEEWELEYACNRVKTSRLHVFGMLGERHVQSTVMVNSWIGLRRKVLQWYCIADPASASCFGVLFVAFDKYTKRACAVNELYVTDMREMSVKKMWPRIAGIIQGFEPDMIKWNFIYDEAATWWANEMLAEYGLAWMPTHKHLNDKEWGLSLIKDQLNNDLMYMSELCPKLYWEMKNYIKDDKGRIPKKNDHLIDCVRYFNGFEVNDTRPENEPSSYSDYKDDIRGYSLEKDLDDQHNSEHWENLIVGDL